MIERERESGKDEDTAERESNGIEVTNEGTDASIGRCTAMHSCRKDGWLWAG